MLYVTVLTYFALFTILLFVVCGCWFCTWHRDTDVVCGSDVWFWRCALFILLSFLFEIFELLKMIEHITNIELMYNMYTLCRYLDILLLLKHCFELRKKNKSGNDNNDNDNILLIKISLNPS